VFIITDPHSYWDNVWLFGFDVQDWSFDDRPWSAWSGSTKQSSSDWTASGNTGWFYGFPKSANTRSGPRSYCLQNFKISDGYAANQGDWVKISQKVAMSGTGVIPSGVDTKVCSLYAPYPNPARIQTRFSYKLDARSKITLNIYDASGRFIRNVFESTQTPGEYDVMWDGKDDAGNDVANGIYFFRMAAGNFAETRQIVWFR